MILMLSLVLEFLLVVFVIGCSEILHLAIDSTAQESGEFLGYSLLTTCTDLTERLQGRNEPIYL